MDIVLSNTSLTPLYIQIYDQILAQILTGVLPPDYCLPSIRAIARELSISVITVKNAYELLEQNGYIYTLAGKGCFVSSCREIISKAELVAKEVDNIKQFCDKNNISTDEIIAALKA